MKDEQHKKTTPKDFFLNLGAIVAIYVSVISFINLLLTTLDNLLPDVATGYYNTYESMRWAVAYLVIAFPVFLILSKILNKDIKNSPEKENLGVRKWLTYLTLFVTGIAMTVDLIWLINSFLSGEITLRFSLKALVILVTSLLVFGYYISKVRGLPAQAGEGAKYEKCYKWTSVALVVAAISFGFYVMGSPFTQRLRNIDEKKVGDLQNIQYQIISYWQQKEFLPEKLSDLEAILGFVVPKDTDKNVDYTYTITGATSFNLCANFNLENEYKNGSPETSAKYPDVGGKNETWAHQQGDYCYERTIDPTLYSTSPKVTPVKIIQ
ncbi:MAG TPA: DUF5671 domain-containing protein [Candidatus Paceibacterota bacterium]|nr:DUF5671 domain-containing protein [Candidatus Paceibacterota bacterium]